ncbi:MAG TPA: PTS system mannose/fructose/sorbose family transporter subunit IID [Gemmatimonadales bacterium]|jgi:PTS system mannose-specific IID component|nr:PTS system mannose/fructose/sorbose family transporter subunit IID [Gemmatimonadales bacterium]
MNGRWRAFLRLFAVQGAWNYERMLGVGMGYAAEPLLEDLGNADPGRHAEAVVRSAEFFNCHPYLAGLALGATVRAEYDQVPGPQIIRLRTALCSPLGALGDQLFWTGLSPALLSAALIAVCFGAGAWVTLVFLLLYNVARIATGIWSLRTGLAAGADVGHKIADSWLPKAARRVGPVAGFLIGLAVPLVGDWALQWVTGYQFALAVGIALLGMFLSLRFRHSITSVRFALGMIALTLAWRWIA